MDIWNWPQWLVDWGKESLRWQLARPYGMFIRMTGSDLLFKMMSFVL